MATDEELRAVVRQALTEGANPRGFTGDVRRVYEEMFPGAARAEKGYPPEEEQQ